MSRHTTIRATCVCAGVLVFSRIDSNLPRGGAIETFFQHPQLHKESSKDSGMAISTRIVPRCVHVSLNSPSMVLEYDDLFIPC